ncbi:helix-turn-helix domain-containing protein [Aquiflexum lacus]|uniref:helix-turn-helix domain-containing protein n=1 Tax=Aquiflexum lacus TaxID=2483805 RepID=UPI001E65C514|nr:helix-turn-helix domain-containing protein [Aquiflexum lacus]
MTNIAIYNFTEFEDFHNMNKSGLKSIHNDIHIYNFKDIGEERVEKTPLFKSNFFQIGVFSDVSFDVSYFGKQKTIFQKNVIVMFKPGQTISFSKTYSESQSYVVIFKESFIDWRVNNSNTIKDFSILNPLSDCVLFLEYEPFKDLLDIAQKMHKEYFQLLSTSSLNILKLYCQLLIEKINRLNLQTVQPILHSLHYKTTQDFKTLVYQNIQNTKSVAEYAEMLFITEKTLTNHFKLITESTPKEFINSVIVEESKALLLDNASVGQVADYFNFNDPAHFSNFFKKKTGQSPNDIKSTIEIK